MFSQASVSHSARGLVHHMHHGIDHMVGVPHPEPLLVTSGGDHWRPVQTCSFQGLPIPLPSEQHLMVATETETRSVSKQVVCILLECFLVVC